MRRAWFLLALAVLLAAGAAISLGLPYRGFGGECFVDIPRGTGSAGVASLLSEAGVVRYRWQFLAVRVLRPRARLQAGEYCFREAGSPWAVLDRLARGDIYFRSLTVPEGQNIFDIAASLDQLGLIGARPFLQAARDPSAIHDLAPQARTLEGYLFPNTYRITRHTTATQLCAQMTSRFRQAWVEAGGSGPVHPIVTLASLIEKETARPEERPLVASVFNNRLAAGMPLDCDPTTIYAAMLDGRYGGEISRADLDSKSPYNTYQFPGLPPGPIANPGLAALRAALHPSETRYLYFVAKPDGSGAHVFSERLEAHQRAVSHYRRGIQKAIQAQPVEPVPRRKAARTPH
jgi:UPF0755 protein